MTRVLVVYYSLEGNTKLVSEAIAKATGGSLLRLVPVKDVDPGKGSKYLWGGQQVVMRKRPVLEPFDVDLESFDLLFIGTPVWAWTFTPALRTFFSKTTKKLSGKRVAVFSTHNGSPGKTLAHMTKQLEGNEIAGERDFCDVLKDPDTSTAAAEAWVRDVLGA